MSLAIVQSRAQLGIKAPPVSIEVQLRLGCQSPLIYLGPDGRSQPGFMLVIPTDPPGRLNLASLCYAI